MKMSLRELAEARAALACFFEQVWPDPDCSCAKEPLDPPELTLQELDTRERRYRRALCTVNALRQSRLTQTRTD